MTTITHPLYNLHWNSLVSKIAYICSYKIYLFDFVLVRKYVMVQSKY